MRRIEKSRAVAAVGGLFCVISLAAAKEGTKTSPESPREPNITPKEMLEQARSYKPAMEKSASAVRQQLSTSRRQRDVVKALCLNDKLSQIELATRTASDRVDSLAAAVSFNDVERSKHEFTVIQVLRDRVNTLLTEANQCIGEETGFVGDSSITVTIDPTIPETDPTLLPVDPVVSVPPVLTTPSY